MAAFDRVLSGIPQMDEKIDNIRLGDNVVWRVDSLEDFKQFATPYVNQAIKDKRNLIYIRFASHEPLFTQQEGLKIVNVELSHRFENFTVEIHEIIRKEGREAFYVFDCLSELQTAWATDLMMGNFFQVTCPYLFVLDTVAFFPLIRGKHSFQAIAKIRDTTQLFLDAYSDKKRIYVRPDKVWNRYSETMFLPHLYEPENGTFKPILDGVMASHFYQILAKDAESLDQEAGMLRLVMGLGTSAVDRTEGSYPRLVSLSDPTATSFNNSAEKHQYSQKKLELINRAERKLMQVDLDKVYKLLPAYLKRLLLEHDFEAERMFRDRGQDRDIEFISCQGLVRKEGLMKDLQNISKLYKKNMTIQ